MDVVDDGGTAGEPSLDELLTAALTGDADERLWAAANLPVGMEYLDADEERAVATLIALTTDPDPDVRDWATFGLGCQIDYDSPAVRAALWARVGDEGGNTSDEAIYGLARRRDPLAAAMVAEALEDREVSTLFFRAAAFLRDPGLADRLRDFEPADADEDDDVRVALRECDPGLRAERDDFVHRLMDLIFARAAEHDPDFSCGVLDLDITLQTDLSREAGTAWDLEALRRVSGGDPEVAAARVLGQLAGGAERRTGNVP